MYYISMYLWWFVLLYMVYVKLSMVSYVYLCSLSCIRIVCIVIYN